MVARLVCFGGFELDLETAELRSKSAATLAQRHTVVEFDRSINAAIMKLRITLGDTADKPTYIETLARRGYRFLATAEFDRPAQLESVVASVQHGSLVGSGCWRHDAGRSLSLILICCKQQCAH
jgi:hypothetical protein